LASPPQRSAGQGWDQGLHGCEWHPAAAVFRQTGHQGGTVPNRGYLSPISCTSHQRRWSPPREDR
jgi:hypothetical protein